MISSVIPLDMYLQAEYLGLYSSPTDFVLFLSNDFRYNFAFKLCLLVHHDHY